MISTCANNNNKKANLMAGAEYDSKRMVTDNSVCRLISCLMSSCVLYRNYSDHFKHVGIFHCLLVS